MDYNIWATVIIALATAITAIFKYKQAKLNVEHKREREKEE